jgi:dTDP-glucose 4,6-dehydratase
MILNAILGKSLPLYGMGENRRDWLFVEDHTDALFLALDRGNNGRTYNIGGESEVKNITIAQKICEILDRKRPKNGNYSDSIAFVDDRLGHDKRYAINTTRIKEELCWQPSVRLDEGLEKTVCWYLENEYWWRDILKKHREL